MSTPTVQARGAVTFLGVANYALSETFRCKRYTGMGDTPGLESCRAHPYQTSWSQMSVAVGVSDVACASYYILFGGPRSPIQLRLINANHRNRRRTRVSCSCLMSPHCWPRLVLPRRKVPQAASVTESSKHCLCDCERCGRFMLWRRTSPSLKRVQFHNGQIVLVLGSSRRYLGKVEFLPLSGNWCGRAYD